MTNFQYDKLLHAALAYQREAAATIKMTGLKSSQIQTITPEDGRGLSAEQRELLRRLKRRHEVN